MKILVTGAKGFVGRNLCSQLNNIKDGKARWYGIGPAGEAHSQQTAGPEASNPAAHSQQAAGPAASGPAAPNQQAAPALSIDAVFEYDIDSTPEQLDAWCRECDFVFNLAGVNRPQNASEFMEGNFGFASTLLDTLKKHGNNCPVMISSSIQATLAGRFGNSEYGRSKKAGEELMFQYSEDTGAKVLVYRFPNLFGKWCRPNYNSAVATFCNNIANDLPIQVNDRSVEMELLYIDDLVDEMIEALKGHEHRCDYNGLEVVPCGAESASAEPVATLGRYCCVPTTHKTTLGEIVDIIRECDASIKAPVQTAMEMPAGSLRYKLMTTYLSYLPQDKAIRDLKMNIDPRGSFTELIHTLNCGQVSINVSKPGITKGQHWHHSKWETFIVVSGHGLIQLRKEGSDEVWNYEVSGEHIQAVHMLPGYTHNIINLSDTEDLVTVMYCNEIFNPGRPDTYGDPV